MGEVIKNCFPPFKNPDEDVKPPKDTTLASLLQRALHATVVLLTKQYGPDKTASLLMAELENIKKGHESHA